MMKKKEPKNPWLGNVENHESMINVIVRSTSVQFKSRSSQSICFLCFAVIRLNVQCYRTTTIGKVVEMSFCIRFLLSLFSFAKFSIRSMPSFIWMWVVVNVFVHFHLIWIRSIVWVRVRCRSRFQCTTLAMVQSKRGI